MTSEGERGDAAFTAPLPDVSVVDTTELRWFADGRLPADVESWFTRSGASGAIEERCDTYRLGGPTDVGVKLRFGETPEVKVLQSVGGYLRLGPGVAGRIEVWRKWSPASQLVDSLDDVRWVDVRKHVTKRRFSPDGDELAFEPIASTDVGCDVEVVSVQVEQSEAWTFAFAAFGPVAGRLESISAAWDALRAPPRLRAQLGRTLRISAGYPSWLASVVSRRVPVPSDA